MTSEFHACARENNCIGLRQGIKGYYACGRKNRCKKKERGEDVVAKSKVKRGLSSVVRVQKAKQAMTKKRTSAVKLQSLTRDTVRVQKAKQAMTKKRTSAVKLQSLARGKAVKTFKVVNNEIKQELDKLEKFTFVPTSTGTVLLKSINTFLNDKEGYHELKKIYDSLKSPNFDIVKIHPKIARVKRVLKAEFNKYKKAGHKKGVSSTDAENLLIFTKKINYILGLVINEFNSKYSENQDIIDKINKDAREHNKKVRVIKKTQTEEMAKFIRSQIGKQGTRFKVVGLKPPIILN